MPATTTAYFHYALSNKHCVALLRTQQQPLRIFTTHLVNKHCVFLLRTQQHPVTSTAYFHYALSNTHCCAFGTLLITQTLNQTLTLILGKFLNGYSTATSTVTRRSTQRLLNSHSTVKLVLVVKSSHGEPKPLPHDFHPPKTSFTPDLTFLIHKHSTHPLNYFTLRPLAFYPVAWHPRNSTHNQHHDTEPTELSPPTEKKNSNNIAP